MSLGEWRSLTRRSNGSGHGIDLDLQMHGFGNYFRFRDLGKAQDISEEPHRSNCKYSTSIEGGNPLATCSRTRDEAERASSFRTGVQKGSDQQRWWLQTSISTTTRGQCMDELNCPGKRLVAAELSPSLQLNTPNQTFIREWSGPQECCSVARTLEDHSKRGSQAQKASSRRLQA